MLRALHLRSKCSRFGVRGTARGLTGAEVVSPVRVAFIKASLDASLIPVNLKDVPGLGRRTRNRHALLCRAPQELGGFPLGLALHPLTIGVSRR